MRQKLSLIFLALSYNYIPISFQLFAVGIEPPKGKLDKGQLLEIAGGEQNLFLPTGGFLGLDAGFAVQITDKVCGDPCDA